MLFHLDNQSSVKLKQPYFDKYIVNMFKSFIIFLKYLFTF